MDEKINRAPAVSGRFYPGNPSELKKLLSVLFSGTKAEKPFEPIRAVISPHAGYVYSGKVAAGAFSKINPNVNFTNVFIIAPSHYCSFSGASIYNVGNYETPLSEIQVNLPLADELIKISPYFKFNSEAHQFEHSLEVQLPFLQFWLKNPFKLIPIVVGQNNGNALQEMARTLLPYFTVDNLFVISSDFSHFPNYTDAQIADGIMANGILEKSVSGALNASNSVKELHLPGLDTCACGLDSVLILLYLIENNPDLEIQKIAYENSGDSAHGDKNRVVGYLSFTVKNAPKPPAFVISATDKVLLLKMARNTLENYFLRKQQIESTDNHPAFLNKAYGVFVTLYKNHVLAGCIGRMESDEPLHITVNKMVLESALHDNRFSPIKADELDSISIEISVLSSLKKIESIDEIVLGKHGILIKKGLNQGTFLPKVAIDQKWNLDEFLGYCSKNKAALGWNGWKTAEIYIYEVVVFSE